MEVEVEAELADEVLDELDVVEEEDEIEDDKEHEEVICC